MMITFNTLFWLEKKAPKYSYRMLKDFSTDCILLKTIFYVPEGFLKRNNHE